MNRFDLGHTRASFIQAHVNAYLQCMGLIKVPIVGGGNCLVRLLPRQEIDKGKTQSVARLLIQGHFQPTFCYTTHLVVDFLDKSQELFILVLGDLGQVVCCLVVLGWMNE